MQCSLCSALVHPIVGLAVTVAHPSFLALGGGDAKAGWAVAESRVLPSICLFKGYPYNDKQRGPKHASGALSSLEKAHCTQKHWSNRTACASQTPTLHGWGLTLIVSPPHFLAHAKPLPPPTPPKGTLLLHTCKRGFDRRSFACPPPHRSGTVPQCHKQLHPEGHGAKLPNSPRKATAHGHKTSHGVFSRLHDTIQQHMADSLLSTREPRRVVLKPA